MNPRMLGLVCPFVGVICLLLIRQGSYVVPQLAPYPLPARAEDALAELANQSDVLILGEIHGTQEVPAIAVALLEPLTKQGFELLALEIPAEQQRPLTDWATGRTTKVPWFFTKDWEDGRGNIQLLSLIRTALSPPFRWKLVCFDQSMDTVFDAAGLTSGNDQLPRLPPSPEEILKISLRRDASMASQLAKERQRLATGAKVLAICGNIHARTTNHCAPNDPFFKFWPSFAAALEINEPAWRVRSVNVIPVSGGYFAMTNSSGDEMPRGRVNKIGGSQKLAEAETRILQDKDWHLELKLPRSTPATFLKIRADEE